MKALLCTGLLLLLTLISYAQTSSLFQLDSLPAKGILLNQGWKFQPGDNMAWAKPDVDDSRWQAIDPLLDLHYLPQIRKSPIGWFRIKFQVDSSLLNKPLALQVNQHIASQIYLNGKLLQRYGRVSADVDQVQAYQPNLEPLGVLFNQPEQVLAIRFSVQQQLPYFYFYPYYKALEIRINQISSAHIFEQYVTRFYKFNIFEGGLFILLGLVFLGVFLVYDKQKANLYCSLTNFSVGFGNLIYIGAVTSSGVTFRTYTAVASWLLMWVFYNLFLFFAIYSLFAPRKGLPFWIVICLFILGSSTLFYNYQLTFILGICLPTSIITIELLRISISAYRKGKRGVSIVIIGLISYLIACNTFYFMMYGFVPNQAVNDNYSIIDITYHLYIVSIPVSLSIFLGREFAFTSKDLEQKLVEVQQLSAQTLAQEQEKQQILATENERLEQQVQDRTLELTHQKVELQSTLQHLQSTQGQLVQREKAGLENELKLERLQKQQEVASYQTRMIELEMQALRAQMNPHFIFNCLNSINRFMLKNESEAASDYLTKFSKLIRLILQNSQSKAVALENELEALQLYIEMEALRFEGQFSYSMRVDPLLEVEDLEVPPLIIQPYVENAIWHGLMHKEGQGQLVIQLQRDKDMLCCLIIDDGIGRKRACELKSKTATKRKSLGMQITAHRLELINTLNEKQTTVEVTDLMTPQGEPCGTQVLLKMPV